MALDPHRFSVFVGATLAWSIGAVAPVGAVAAPLPAPAWDRPEPVVIQQIVTARELVVARNDGSTLRVRVPGVTVPEGLAGEAPVCGADEAKAALALIAPVGSKAQLAVAVRSQGESWPPYSTAKTAASDLPSYSADGALYADLAVDPKFQSTTTVAEKMVALGWMRPGVPLATALADPSEIGVSNALAVLDDGARTALRAQRGIYARCGGDFRAAAPVVAVPTSWKVTKDGWVEAIAGVSVHDDKKKRIRRSGKMVTATVSGRPGFGRFVEAWGPGVVTLVPGGCAVRWPARGVTIASKVDVDRLVRRPLAPPRDEVACLALPIGSWEGHGVATQLGTLPVRSSLARVRKVVSVGPRSRFDRSIAYTGPDDDNTRFVGQLQLGLDRRSRLAELVLSLNL